MSASTAGLNWRQKIISKKVRLLRQAQRNQVVIASIIVGALLGLVWLVYPPLSFVIVLVVGFLLFAIEKPIVLCYIMIPAIVLTSGMERGRIIPQLTPSEAGLMGSLGLIVLLLLAKRDYRRLYSPNKIIVATVIWVVGTAFIPLAAYFVRSIPLNIQDVMRLVAPIQYCLLFFIYFVVPESEEQRKRIVILMLVSSAIVAMIGLMQGAGVGFVHRILYSWYPSAHTSAVVETGGRVTSVMGAWNSLGILFMAVIVTGWSTLPFLQKFERQVFLAFLMVICMACLIASGSFAGLGGLIIGIGFSELLLQRGAKVIPLFLGLGLFMTVALIALSPVLGPLVADRLEYQFGGNGGQIGMPQTLAYRFEVWDKYFFPVIFIPENFVWGFRPTIPDNFGWTTEESQYIYLIFGTGIFGLIGHLIWVTTFSQWVFDIYRRRDGFQKGLAISTFSILMVLSIAGLTNAVFTFFGSTDYMWILFALIAGHEMKLKSEEALSLKDHSP